MGSGRAKIRRDFRVANLEPVKRDKYSGFLWTDLFSGSDVEPTTPILLSGVLGTTLCFGT